MHVIGSNHADTQFLGHLGQKLVATDLLLDAVIVQFHEEVFLPEDIPVGGGEFPGTGFVVRKNGLIDLPLEAPAKPDNPLPVLREQLLVDPRLVVHSVEMGDRNKPH
jgi:hypothetical protein